MRLINDNKVDLWTRVHVKVPYYRTFLSMKCFYSLNSIDKIIEISFSFILRFYHFGNNKIIKNNIDKKTSLSWKRFIHGKRKENNEEDEYKVQKMLPFWQNWGTKIILPEYFPTRASDKGFLYLAILQSKNLFPFPRGQQRAWDLSSEQLYDITN